LIVGLTLLGGLGAAPARESAPEPEGPATGRFLIATDQVRGSFFHQSVVFLVSYTENGSLGLIVNRRTGVTLHDVVQGAVDGAGDLYLGGPVELSSVMVLLRAQSPPERAVRVTGDLFMTVDAALLLEHTGKPGGAGDLRVYAGYTGWGPGQLESEIAHGDWIVAREPIESIFDSAPEELWKKLHLRHHRLLAFAR
jgi:putative transcriptional regulator